MSVSSIRHETKVVVVVADSAAATKNVQNQNEECICRHCFELSGDWKMLAQFIYLNDQLREKQRMLIAYKIILNEEIKIL